MHQGRNRLLHQQADRILPTRSWGDPTAENAAQTLTEWCTSTTKKNGKTLLDQEVEVEAGDELDIDVATGAEGP